MTPSHPVSKSGKCAKFGELAPVPRSRLTDHAPSDCIPLSVCFFVEIDIAP